MKKCELVTKQECSEQKSAPNCRLIEKSVPKEECKLVTIPQCEEVTKEVCDTIKTQRCETVPEKVNQQVKTKKMG